MSSAVQMSFPSHNFLLHMLLGMLGDVLPSVCPGSDSGFSPKGGTGAKNLNHFKNNHHHLISACASLLHNRNDVRTRTKYLTSKIQHLKNILISTNQPHHHFCPAQMWVFSIRVFFLQVINNFLNIYSAVRPAGQAMLEMNLFIQSVL